MLPLFRPGETALAETGARPDPGDCAVYLWEDRTLLHRVIRAEEAGAWLADDAGRIAPHFVPWAAVLGRVCGGGPFAGGLLGRLYSFIRRRALGPLVSKDTR